MPAQFHIGLPNDEQRLKILQLILSNEVVAKCVELNRISKLTQGFSGSDLRELCRHASVYRIRQYMRANSSSLEKKSSTASDSSNSTNEAPEEPPPITMDDLICSLTKMRESKMHTGTLPLQALDTRIDLD